MRREGCHFLVVCMEKKNHDFALLGGLDDMKSASLLHSHSDVEVREKKRGADTGTQNGQLTRLLGWGF